MSYPWLCSTIRTDTFCDKSSGANVADVTTDKVDEITAEETDLYGLKMTYYVVSENLKRDRLLGEDQLQFIERAFYFTGYLTELPPNVRSYQLQGIWGEDVMQVFISKSFYYYSTYGKTGRNTPEVYEAMCPRVGDIVYFNTTNKFYELIDFSQWENAFGLKSHYYRMTCRVFKDTKYTISDNDTIPKDDPIYNITTPSIDASANFYDYLQNTKNLNYSGNYLYI